MARKTLISIIFRAPTAEDSSTEFNEWIADGNEDIEIISSNLSTAPGYKDTEITDSILHVIYRGYTDKTEEL